MNLNHLTDKVLLADTKQLAQEYRSVTTKLLHHLREIEARYLYAELGYSSLFNYVVQELGFSESSASRRIKTARLLSELPELEKKIEAGELTLTNLSKVVDAFKLAKITDIEFKKEVIATIENTSTRTCEKTLLDITGANKPPVQEIKPLTKTTTLLSVTLTDEELKIYQDLKGLVQQNFWTIVLKTALGGIISQKFKTSTTRHSSSQNPRYVTAQLKKTIYERDKKCTLCGSNFKLEFDHITPYSLGGKTTESNLRLLCRNCNQRQRIKQKL